MAGLFEAPSMNTLKVERFKGIDVSVPENQQKLYRAANALNMIPDAAGEVRKRPGIQFERTMENLSYPVEEWGERVEEVLYGGHLLTKVVGVDKWVVYRKVDGVYSYVASADKKPLAARFGDSLFIFLVCDDNKGNTVGTFFHRGQDTEERYAFSAGVVIFNSDGTLLAYNDKGCRWENGFYSEIPYDDELLEAPTIIMGAAPEGGGNPHQQINLLSPWVTESYCVKKPGTSVFYLNSQAADEGDYATDANYGNDIAPRFRVQVLANVTEEDEGVGGKIQVPRWIDRPIHAGDGYRISANRFFINPEGNKNGTYVNDKGETVTGFNIGDETGYIGATPEEGKDNVRITHWRADFSESFIEICRCVCAATYGVSGYKDRLFLGGNSGNSGKNRVYYSELENPLYFGALNYIETEAGSRVMALDGTAGNLAILTDRGVVFAIGKATDGEQQSFSTDAVFAVSNIIKSPAPLNIGNTAVLGGELVYLSEHGVIAIAAKENYDERYAEYRSAMIDRAMMADRPQRILNLGRYLLIFCADGICWLLDENQPNSEGDKPYAAHQYEGYRMDGFWADAYFIENDSLKLIRGGDVYQWMGGEDASHYHDGEETPINAWWETPWIYGSTFHKNKIFMQLGILLGMITDVNSGATVEFRKDNEEWKPLIGCDSSLCRFNYKTVDYRLFTYQTVQKCPDMQRKIKIKKAKRIKLRFSNDFRDQPFILRGFGLDYVQEG